MKIVISGDLENVRLQVAALHGALNNTGGVAVNVVSGDPSDKPAVATDKTTRRSSKTKTDEAAKEVAAQNVEAAKSEPVKAQLMNEPEATLNFGGAPATEAPKVTKDEVNKALSDLNSKLGMEVARAALQKFDAARISELKEENYAKFVQECNNQLALA